MRTASTPILTASVIALLAWPALAENKYWDGSGTGWDVLGSWSTDAAAAVPDPTTIPGAADTAIFNITGVTTAQTVNLNGNQAIDRLQVGSSGGVTLLGGDTNRVLSLGVNGIGTLTGAGALTIGSTTDGQRVDVSLQGSQTWTNGSGGTGAAQAIVVQNNVSAGVAGPVQLTLAGNTTTGVSNIIAGVISDGAGVLSLRMNGGPNSRWFLTGANTYTGETLISAGGVRVQNSAGLGSTSAGTVVTSGGTLILDNNIHVVGEALSISGDGPGSIGGALLNATGANRWSSAIAVNTGTVTGRIGATGGSLTIDGAINATGTGQLVFQANGGSILVNGDISHPGQRITKAQTGTSTATLAGNNTYGDTTVSSGTLQFGNGGTTGNVGTGSITMAAAGTFAMNRSDDVSIGNTITGAGAVSHRGRGKLTLSGANGHTGNTSLAGGGELVLDFAGTATNVVGAGAFSVAGGGRLSLLGRSTDASSQTFTSLSLTQTGHLTIAVNSNGGSGTNLALGGITRSGGSTVNFILPAAGSITTTTANANGSILGNFATVSGTDWAVSAGTGTEAGAITALASYTDDAWAAGNNTTVTGSSAPAAASTTNSLRFNANTAATLTLSGVNTIASQGILVTSNVGANLSQISGGNIAIADGTEFIITQNNTQGGLTLSSSFSGGTGRLTKTGDGLLTLASANTYSGVTTISAGTLSISNQSAIGSNGSGTSITFPLGGSGTLQITGTTFNSGRGVALSGNGILDVPTTSRAVFSGTTVASGAGSLFKTGGGELVFSSTSSANTYTGATIIEDGVIQVNRLNNGGANSAVGASTSDAANLVLNGGTLRFSSTTAASSTDRLFTVGTEGGTIEASGGAGFGLSFTNPGAIALAGSNTARTLTLGGTNTGANVLTPLVSDNGAGATSLQKTGAGAWTLAGGNTYSGGTTVAGGSLIGTVDRAFGSGNVTVADTAVSLTIQTGVLDAIANTATLSLAGDGVIDSAAIAGYAFLAAGVNEIVGSLILGGVVQTGLGETYGATGSGAVHIMDDYFQGPGLVTIIPEPSTAIALFTGLALLGARRARRRAL